MNEVSIIGLDIAKHVFHAHGVDAGGRQVFSRRIGRGKLLDFFATQPRCLMALEACGGAHHWTRELMRMGHEVRLIPPTYVKPFRKRSGWGCGFLSGLGDRLGRGRVVCSADMHSISRY